MTVATPVAVRDPRSVVGAWSVPATRRRVLEMMDGIDWRGAKICDVGAGSGLFSQVLCEYVRNVHGLEPREHVFACDLDPTIFHFDEIDCCASAADGRLPFDDNTFDVTLLIEVIEHVEDQFAFFRELTRITKPGGRVIVTTPNVLNMNSRVRNLFVGFPLLFGLLPLSEHDPRFLGGHIHPISPYFLAYNAVRAELGDIVIRSDRTKRSSALLAVLCYPFLCLGELFYRRYLKRKDLSLLTENEALFRQMSGWELLTGRTTVLRGIKRA